MGSHEHLAAALVSGLLCLAPPVHARDCALLVGVSDYPHLSATRALRGPVNDVTRLARVLERFGFGAPNITILASDRPTAQPTRERILAELGRLAGSCRSGDQAVVFLSGHASQEPARADLPEHEPDGLEEIFLPCDVKGWDGAKGRVENAIADSEIGQALDNIRARGAFVLFLADCCHAGTMTRAGLNPDERERGVPVEELVPIAALSEARRRAVKGGAERDRGLWDAGLPGKTQAGVGGLVGLLACQAEETTPEKPLPFAGDACHGLFSFTLVEAIERARSPLMYRELAEQIYVTYRAQGRRGPTPVVEGGDLERQAVGRASVEAAQKDNQLPGHYIKNIIVVTDGQENNSPANWRQLVRENFPNAYANLFVIGVGKDAKLGEFEGVADLCLHIDNYDELLQDAGSVNTEPQLLFRRPDGTVAGREIGRELVVGRAPTADVVIASSKASRRQFRLALERDVAVLRDLRSRNGTYVNGQKVKERQLLDGDVIEAGGLLWVYLDRLAGP